ncbi:SufD family Fe-S cluster assembly protein [bacterium]|nr:SufD family Fe-S cluster assembly protein [bacterium]
MSAVKCDALILDEESVSRTIPFIDCNEASALISHEASAGKVDELQLFYLMSK